MLVVLREACEVNGRPREGREVDEPQAACHGPYVGNRAHHICYGGSGLVASRGHDSYGPRSPCELDQKGQGSKRTPMSPIAVDIK